MSDVILRKIWLENETGDSIPLNGERGIWFVDPTGLGVNNNSTFTNFSYGFFSPVEEDKDPQQTIAGDLYFIDPIDPYMMYRRFVDWVSLAKTLYLVYSPTPTRYRRKIKLNYLTKTELTTQQCLKAPIAMYGLTPWFTKTEYRIEGEAGALADPFIVNQSRLNIGRLQRDSRSRVSTVVYATGHRPAALVLTYTGNATNPMIRIYGKDSGQLYGMCSTTDLKIEASETFSYSSEYGNSYIIKRTNYDAIDLLNNVENLSSDVYPRIPIIEPCVVEFSSSDTITGVTYLTVVNYYRGV